MQDSMYYAKKEPQNTELKLPTLKRQGEFRKDTINNAKEEDNGNENEEKVTFV